MDPEQFKMFMDHQTRLFSQLLKGINQPTGRVPGAQPLGANVSVPQPSPLALDGDMEQNFEFFENSWIAYSKAIGMDHWPEENNSQKVSFLLSVIGEQARKKYFNFELTVEEQASPQAALAAIKGKVLAKRNIIIDRLDFFSASQMPGESIDDFTTRLKWLGKIAKLGVLEAELIAFKVVTANKWPELRTKMLTVQDITLTKAVDMCRAEEITKTRSHELGLSPNSEVNKIVKHKSRTLRCKFCGDRHEFSKRLCPALGKRCHRCKGKNHFEKVCKANRKPMMKTKKRVKEISGETSESEEESSHNDASSEESEEIEIGKIMDDSEKGGCVLAELDLKLGSVWKSVKCELDTGANASLIGRECLAKLRGEAEPQILPTKLRLQSFGGNSIKVLGQVKIPCRRKGKKYSLVLQVVEGDHRPLLSAKASRVFGFVKFCKTVSFTERKISETNLLNVYRIQAQKIVEAHSDIFVGYGKFSGPVSLEVDSNVQPSIQPPRRVPIALRDNLRKELAKLEKDGVIVKETAHTDWVSNIVLVQRGSESSGIRICLDPVPLNKALKRPNLQFVTLDEILPELGKAKIFSTVDAKKGFWHVELDESSSKLTTFWTPFGRYRWTRLPFGIAPAPEIFQMKLQEIIQGLQGVECIADDLLVYGTGDTLEKALAEHNRCLENLLIRLEKHNVKLNRSKLRLCQTSVKFYGHMLTDTGLQADESKIATIREYPTPTNRKEVHRFVGMVNYLSRFIQNLSANLTNLRKLISESVPWQWSCIEEEEFSRVKSLVADIRSLRYYNVHEPLTIECDASCFGLGVAVYQSDGVIGYASRTLTPTERNYAQIEKELLAILFACVRFDQLIVGNPKTIIKTDHKPLVNLFQKPLLSAPRRLQHMLLNLQRCRLTIEFVTGKENVVADALSRAPINAKEKDLTPESVIKVCKINFARHGVPQRVICDNGTNFVNQKMSTFAREWDFELVTSAPHHQQANGKSEAAVKIAKRLLKKANDSGTDFWYTLLHWRNIPNKIGSSPAARFLSRSTRYGVPTPAVKLFPRVVKDVPAAIEKNRKLFKYHYDKTARVLPELQTGSPVFVQLHPETNKIWTPGIISNRLNDRSYQVNVEGVNYRRSLVHLKPRKDPIVIPDKQPQPINPELKKTMQTLDLNRKQHTFDSENFVVPQRETTSPQPAVIVPPSQPSMSSYVTTSSPTVKSRERAPPQTNEISNSRPKREIRIPARFNDYSLK
ncbi:uncharacterized protein K02A2.6-like [Sabethes cyaneus]|uniref:uncharacterized protein K02A2.6-like n=1 Tax=Sabethes cyaneus TaxID=53552 RepID=UPI00237DF361|nr:uncharacterized protein K02A2.6-like [Sabethes cyaneus]